MTRRKTPRPPPQVAYEIPDPPGYVRPVYAEALSQKSVHPLMLEAARNALALSVWPDVNIHIFAAPYKTKVAFKKSHGSLDARGNFTPDGRVQTEYALLPWTAPKARLASNPNIRLDKSGLVAIDVDHGLAGCGKRDVAT
jgi:hypothetical protein